MPVSLAQRALRFSRKAVEVVMADPRRVTAIAQMVGRVQKGKQQLEIRQEDAMRALQLSTTGDFKALSKRLAGIKRRIRELDERVEDYSTKMLKDLPRARKSR